MRPLLEVAWRKIYKKGRDSLVLFLKCSGINAEYEREKTKGQVWKVSQRSKKKKRKKRRYCSTFSVVALEGKGEGGCREGKA